MRLSTVIGLLAIMIIIDYHRQYGARMGQSAVHFVATGICTVIMILLIGLGQ